MIYTFFNCQNLKISCMRRESSLRCEVHGERIEEDHATTGLVLASRSRKYKATELVIVVYIQKDVDEKL